MAAGLVSVNGTGLFVDDRGDATAPALLFIHGGPGQSCYDFMQIQGRRAGTTTSHHRLDQRGTLRSDPLPAEPALTAELLIADFEALREQLETASRAILGHSDGGGYALQYVTSNPEAVHVSHGEDDMVASPQMLAQFQKVSAGLHRPHFRQIRSFRLSGGGGGVLQGRYRLRCAERWLIGAP